MVEELVINLLLFSVDVELGLLLLESLHLGSQNGVDIAELILVRLETQCEEREAELEEFVVFGSVKDGWLYVTDQVLEEGTDHDVDDLADFDVHIWLQRCPLVELLEVYAAGDVLLSTSLEQLVEGRECKVLPIDCLTEIEGHIVHQEPKVSVLDV